MSYLTKTRFVQACSCPTKLHYATHEEYQDKLADDPFMAALADGGYQIGELAKCMHPEGVDLGTLDTASAIAQTMELMKRGSVVIFEATIEWNGCLVKVDVLVKDADHIYFYEVKAKSYNSTEESPFVGKKGGLVSDWKKYLFDVAFQQYVLNKAFPEFEVTPFLRLVDKSAVSSIDGINQKFRVTSVNGRRQVKVDPEVTLAADADGLLVDVPMADLIHRIHTTEEFYGETFAGFIDSLLLHIRNDHRFTQKPGKQCKACEYAVRGDALLQGKKSGFEVCWSDEFNWTENDFSDPNILEIWNYRLVDNLVDEGRLKLDDLTLEDFGVAEPDGGALASKQRQWLQVKKRSTGDTDAYLAKGALQQEMDSWTYPLHMIDFETITPALPFTRQRHPYELVVFQFSHHKLYEDGRVEHATEYLNSTIGDFPNVEFLRALKAALSNDHGSVFCYSAHENTCLNTICEQISSADISVPDSDELIAFSRTLTKSSAKSKEARKGNRVMVDLLELVKNYYYDPAMIGSNSIKKVLPAILNSSPWLQQQYGRPIYGAAGGIPSKNFSDWVWISKEEGSVVDPYAKLPKLFSELSPEDELLISDIEDLADGGAALTAYAKLQFYEMSEAEHDALEAGLLRYCELDTLAMVMIVEGWREMLLH